MSSLFNHVLRNLISPQSIDNLRLIEEAIEAYKDPRFLKYSTLSEELNEILSEDENTRYEQLIAIEQKIKDCLDSDIPDSIDHEDFQHFVRFCDHVKLETGREKRYLDQLSNIKNNIQRLQGKTLKDISESFEKKSIELDKQSKNLETNLSTNNILSFVKDLLLKMNLDLEDFSFSLSEVPFDINDEDSWSEGLIPVAKLFYNLVENLILTSKITADEVEKLKTKEYTKTLFQSTDYPAIANNRTDNMGNSTQKRYRAKALKFEGADIYISTQFFDSDRDAIIEWYKDHTI